MSSEIAHEGIVHTVAGGEATVAVATAGCSACDKRSACGVGKLAAGARTTLVSVPVTADFGTTLRPGDAVSLSVSEDALTRAALLGYLWPALGLVVGAVVGQASYGDDIAAALGALGGLIVALLTTRLMALRYPQSVAPLTLQRRQE